MTRVFIIFVTFGCLFMVWGLVVAYTKIMLSDKPLGEALIDIASHDDVVVTMVAAMVLFIAAGFAICGSTPS